MNTVKFDEIKGRTNHVELRGNLTADPSYDAKFKYALLRVATSRPVEIKGQQSEEVLFIDVEFRSKDAEAAAKFLKKGSPVFVEEGALKQDRWEKGGEKHSKVKVVAFKVAEVDFKKEGQKLSGYPTTVTFEDLKKNGKNSNTVTLKANLTKDAEFRVTPGGSKVADLRVAVNRKYKSGDEVKEEVSYFDVTQFGDKAQEAGELKKGEPIFLEGKINMDEWETKGEKKEKRTALNIRAFNIAKVEQTRRQDESAEEDVGAGQKV